MLGSVRVTNYITSWSYLHSTSRQTSLSFTTQILRTTEFNTSYITGIGPNPRDPTTFTSVRITVVPTQRSTLYTTSGITAWLTTFNVQRTTSRTTNRDTIVSPAGQIVHFNTSRVTEYLTTY